VVVDKAVEIDIVLSNIIHDNHAKATGKTLYNVKFGSMSFRSAISMNVLAVLMGEFDTQLLASGGGVEIAKENIVVFGCQLRQVPERVRRWAGSKRGWIRICRVATIQGNDGGREFLIVLFK